MSAFVSSRLAQNLLIPFRESNVFFEVIPGVLGHSVNFNITYRFLWRRPVFPDYLFLMTMIPTEKWDEKREIPWWGSNVYFFARVSICLTSKISKEIWKMVIIWSENMFNPFMTKVYFAWKRLKVDYSKNIWKEENRGHCFICLSVGCISVKKIIETRNSVRAGARNIGKVVSFWPKFDPNFTNIWRA